MPKSAKLARKPKAKPKAKPMSKPMSKPKPKPEGARYHHGGLRQALVSAAESILVEEGPAHLTLRAAARRAGVSHAAPAHHFGDLAGLLTELAAVGFERMGARLAAAALTGDPELRHAYIGRAYVGFARENRALFQLMFRSHALDQTEPHLRDAAARAFGGFAAAFGGGKPGPMPLAAAASLARAWSLVHGFAFLSIDGRLKRLLQSMDGPSEDDLLDAVLFGPPPARPAAQRPQSR